MEIGHKICNIVGVPLEHVEVYWNVHFFHGQCSDGSCSISLLDSADSVSVSE